MSHIDRSLDVGSFQGGDMTWVKWLFSVRASSRENQLRAVSYLYFQHLGKSGWHPTASTAVIHLSDRVVPILYKELLLLN